MMNWLWKQKWFLHCCKFIPTQIIIRIIAYPIIFVIAGIMMTVEEGYFKWSDIKYCSESAKRHLEEIEIRKKKGYIK